MHALRDSNHRRLIKAARSQGFVITSTGKNHLRFRHPDGRLYFASSTPGDRRSYANLRSGLRRLGIKLKR